MRLVMLSNVFSHHQYPVADALYAALGADFCFIETLGLTAELRALGYTEPGERPYWLRLYQDREQEARKRIREADAVIAGAAPEWLLRERKAAGGLILRCSERPLKQGPEPLKALPRLLKWHLINPPGRPIYLLCAGAFVAGDYRRYGLFRGRCYRWGYFPPTRRYTSLEGLLAQKEHRTILWCGRLLDWKHPELALDLAGELKRRGMDFQMKLIGTGPMENALRAEIEKRGLRDRVRLLGPMPPEQVRGHMERAGLFLICSDRREGWGAVLNEAMNSGCAVLASDAIGAAPYLLRDGENGRVFPSGDLNTLTALAASLLSRPEEQTRLGAAAYRTVTELWNAETATARLLTLTQSLVEGGAAQLYDNGPCSRAEH